MITEVRFANSHSSFWRGALPMAEACIRTINMELARFAAPLCADTLPGRRGLINETATQIYSIALREQRAVRDLDQTSVERAVAIACEHIHSLRSYSRGALRAMDHGEMAESSALAERIGLFFDAIGVKEPIVAEPPFSGCGWVSRCFGDYLAGTTLYEIKAGERRFRTTDFRQVLTYCALNFGAKAYDISSVCLVNPREGTWFYADLRRLCAEFSGRRPDEVFAEIMDYVSEPIDFAQRNAGEYSRP